MNEITNYNESILKIREVVNYYNRYEENMDKLVATADFDLYINNNRIYAEYCNKVVTESYSKLEDYKNNRTKYLKKLKRACFKRVFEVLNLSNFMNARQKTELDKNIDDISNELDLTEENCLMLLEQYRGNIHKAIYDSVSDLAGKMTSRESDHKTNSKAYKFNNKHIVRILFAGLGSYNKNYAGQHYQNMVLDLFKIHDLIYPDTIKAGNGWFFDKFIEGTTKVSENISIKRFKNGNGHLFLSDDICSKLNKMIAPNTLK